jgi:hypothetical protein
MASPGSLQAPVLLHVAMVVALPALLAVTGPKAQMALNFGSLSALAMISSTIAALWSCVAPDPKALSLDLATAAFRTPERT